MRRIAALIMFVLAAGLMLAAAPDQGVNHPNATEAAVKAELKIPSETIVGSCLLQAGTYVVACDRDTVTFTLKSTGEVMASLACRGAVMKDKAKETKGVYEKQPSGYMSLEKLYLKGSNVEHVF